MTYRLEEGSLIELTSTIASKEVSLPQTLTFIGFTYPYHKQICQVVELRSFKHTFTCVMKNQK